MKPLSFEVTVTEELLDAALSYLREAAAKAGQWRTSDYRWIPISLAAILIPLALIGAILSLLMLIAGPGDRLGHGLLAAFFTVILLLSPPLIVYSKKPPGSRLAERLYRSSMTRSVNLLRGKVPYVVRYQLDNEQIEANVASLNIRRRTPLPKVKSIFVCEHFFAMRTGAVLLLPLRLVYVDSPEQHADVAMWFKARKFELVELTHDEVFQATTAESS